MDDFSLGTVLKQQNLFCVRSLVICDAAGHDIYCFIVIMIAGSVNAGGFTKTCGNRECMVKYKISFMQ